MIFIKQPERRRCSIIPGTEQTAWKGGFLKPRVKQAVKFHWIRGQTNSHRSPDTKLPFQLILFSICSLILHPMHPQTAPATSPVTSTPDADRANEEKYEACHGNAERWACCLGKLLRAGQRALQSGSRGCPCRGLRRFKTTHLDTPKAGEVRGATNSGGRWYFVFLKTQLQIKQMNCFVCPGTPGHE